MYLFRAYLNSKNIIKNTKKLYCSLQNLMIKLYNLWFHVCVSVRSGVKNYWATKPRNVDLVVWDIGLGYDTNIWMIYITGSHVLEFTCYRLENGINFHIIRTHVTFVLLFLVFRGAMWVYSYCIVTGSSPVMIWREKIIVMMEKFFFIYGIINYFSFYRSFLFIY